MHLFSEVQNERHRAKMKVLSGLVPSGMSRGASMPCFFQLLKISSTGLCLSCRVKGVRKGEVWGKNKTGTFQEQITFNKARRDSSQISELLH